MKQRCFNPHNKSYKNYGGRGITIFPKWINDYTAFRQYIEQHLGPKPSPEHSIDRINNDGNYEPDNLRWATPPQQGENQRPSSNSKLGKILATLLIKSEDDLFYENPRFEPL
jgi:hypothetical protein